MWTCSRRLCQLVVITAALSTASVSALHAEPEQPLRALPPDAAIRATTFAADLVFPERAEAVEALASPRAALLKPSGDGPFPALVMVHQCAGLNPAVAHWAREGVRRGYVVLLIDSLKPRDVQTVCYGPRAGVNLFRGAKDAFQAAAHLRNYPFVDPSRISFVGYSWGAMVGLIVASARYTDALGGRPFASITSFYPGCFRVSRPNAPVFDLVSDDMKQPVLVLMGDADNETPAAECVGKLQHAKSSGSLVDWHVYPDTGHCWDCQQLDGRTKTDMRGNQISYRFSAAATHDSSKRLFAFLGALPAK
ncbi:dienelactone hydrolase family protein [Tardiphaga alba]|nr:dienelactone hydrolase family protein [Tardiphaga alba]